MANPLNDLLRGFDVLREQVREGLGADADWLDRLDPRKPPEDTRSLEELQAELDSLVGLETVKDQVRALVAFLQVQGQRLERGLPEVATS
jgi:stage V sporulation protein K